MGFGYAQVIGVPPWCADARAGRIPRPFHRTSARPAAARRHQRDVVEAGEAEQVDDDPGQPGGDDVGGVARLIATAMRATISITPTTSITWCALIGLMSTIDGARQASQSVSTLVTWSAEHHGKHRESDPQHQKRGVGRIGAAALQHLGGVWAAIEPTAVLFTCFIMSINLQGCNVVRCD